jgi:hypothetical protein
VNERVCKRCNAHTWSPRSPYCRVHRPPPEVRARWATKTREARGYGSGHITMRAQYARLVKSGQAVCVRCGLPIAPGAPFDLDHDATRAGYLGVSHRTCNRREGGKRGWLRTFAAAPASTRASATGRGSGFGPSRTMSTSTPRRCVSTSRKRPSAAPTSTPWRCGPTSRGIRARAPPAAVRHVPFWAGTAWSRKPRLESLRRRPWKGAGAGFRRPPPLVSCASTGRSRARCRGRCRGRSASPARAACAPGRPRNRCRPRPRSVRPP